jgi:hypothetical protein
MGKRAECDKVEIGGGEVTGGGSRQRGESVEEKRGRRRWEREQGRYGKESRVGDGKESRVGEGGKRGGEVTGEGDQCLTLCETKTMKEILSLNSSLLLAFIKFSFFVPLFLSFSLFFKCRVARLQFMYIVHILCYQSRIVR